MKGILPWIGGAIIGAAIISLCVWLSDFDKNSNTEYIEGWTILSKDVAFNGMGPEDRIEIIVTYVAEGADPRPAWPLVTEMLNNAYADLYAEGFVDCQEECEAAIDQIHNVYTLLEGR